MIKIGIRAHDLGRFSAAEMARTVRAAGFDGCQLVFAKALTEPIVFHDLLPVKAAFAETPIFMLGAYFNPVHPDESVRKAGIDAFKDHLFAAKTLGIPYVGTETGSLMGSPWGYLPANHRRETFDALCTVIADLVETAEQADSYIAIEGAWAHVAYSPLLIRELLDRIQSPRLKVTVDLFNFLHLGNIGTRMEILEECLRLFSEDIVIWHLKDFVVRDGQLKQVGLGQGEMDFPALLARIVRATPGAVLIFEGVTGGDIAPSLGLIRRLITKE